MCHIKMAGLSCAGIVLLSLLSGCFHNPADSEVIGDQYQLFSMVWEEYEANYPEFTVKGVNWKDIFYEYSPLAEQAETTEELMMEIVRPMLIELKDEHITLYKPNGAGVSTYYPENVEKNYRTDVLLDNYLLPAEFTGYSGCVGYCNPDILPYLSINSWTTGMSVSRVVDFLEQVADMPAIIIDVRMNCGGNALHIDSIAGFFTSTFRPAWHARFRDGPGYDDVVYILVGTYPNRFIYFPGTIYLLIGGYVASACEGFTLHMMNLDNVVLVGDTTWGCVNASFPMALSDGWQVSRIDYSARTIDNEPVEDHGIPPDIYVEATDEDFDQGVDPVLEYAIELVNSKQ